MPSSIIAAISLVTAGALLAQTQAAETPRERVSFNDGWRFLKEGNASDASWHLRYDEIKPWVNLSGAAFTKAVPPQAPAGDKPGEGANVAYVKPDFDDSAWRAVTLPHDFGIEGPFDQALPGETAKLPWWGVAWYRKSFDLPATDAGRRIALDVDGAMSHAVVWCNGKFVGGWPYGYASWRVDLTPFVKPGGKNVVVIRLDNPPESSRWYPGGGIYRNVWLVKTSPVHVAHWGVFVETLRVENGEVLLKVKTEIENHTGKNVPLNMRVRIHELSDDGKKSAKPVAEIIREQNFPSGAVTALRSDYSITFPNPKLWSIEHPNRYVAVTTLEQNGKVVDQVETPFGIRTVEFTKDNGFLLNGKRVPLNGVCDHHDLGALGAAINTRALERQLEILKSMGCNAIRTSHNPPASELLDLCDRMGFVVMDEAFDCWKLNKKPNDYSTLYDDWHQKDMRAFVRRDRNHPCVIMWSIGNEIPEQGRPEGPAMAKELAGYVHEEDPTRPTTFACSDTRGGYNGYQTGVGVFGYNYKPWEYKKFRAANPAQPIFGSETSSCISSRGEYFFPVSNNKADGKSDFQMSSYDLYAPGWAWPPDVEFKGLDEAPFAAGEFVWTGFDYLGEPTPYNSDTTNLLNWTSPADKAKAEEELKALGKIRVPSRSSYFGIIDLAGFPKDRYYLYQARWRPDFPMAHILPHWNWPDRVGEVTPVFVYTNGDEAELFLNGKSLGRKKRGQFEYRLRWDDVKHTPGELKAVAYKGGRHWAENIVKTTGPAAKLTLKADRAVIKADGRDLSFVTVAVADKDGLPVPRSKNPLKFEISGPGEIVATDNGDAADHTVFSSHERSAFNGLALVIVRSKPGAAGTVILSAKSDGLAGAETKIETK